MPEKNRIWEDREAESLIPRELRTFERDPSVFDSDLLAIGRQVVAAFAAGGRGEQIFLGARWVSRLMALAPECTKHRLALRLLGWSPHYFYRDRDPSYRDLSTPAFLDAEFQRMTASREFICDHIVGPYVSANSTVLDYGCGSGFLAKALSSRVRKVIACDISGGVLTCANVLNGADNVRFLLAEGSHPLDIPAGSIDCICSFAVIQHVSNAAFEHILTEIHRLLVPGAKALLHVVTDDPSWKSEEEWRADTGLRGAVKLKYGLNCFGRTAINVHAMIAKAGFCRVEKISIREIAEWDDDISDSDLFVCTKFG